MPTTEHRNLLKGWRGILETRIQVRPLTEDEMRMFVQLSVAPEHVVKGIIEDLRKERQGFQLAVLEKRLEAAGLTGRIEDALKVWYLLLSKNVAELVMWCYTSAVVLHERQMKVYTLDEWARRDFPMGVPTEQAMNDVWDEQKGLNIARAHPDWGVPPRLDNAIDNFLNWPEVIERDLTSNVILPGEEV
jgi:hypothetical protein